MGNQSFSITNLPFIAVGLNRWQWMAVRLFT